MIVKYSKKFPYAPYLNEDIGFEITIPDDGNPEATLTMLKLLAEDFHKKNNPQLQDEPTWKFSTSHVIGEPFQYNGVGEPNFQPKQAPLPSIDYKAIEAVDDLRYNIEKSNSIETLAIYKEDAAKHGLTTQYMDKLKKLTQ